MLNHLYNLHPNKDLEYFQSPKASLVIASTIHYTLPDSVAIF